MDANTLPPELRRLLGGIRLYSDDRPYALVSLPRDQMRPATILFGGLAEPFAAMIVDKDEITIVLHEVDWSLAARDLPGMRVENGYRLITFDTALALGLVGFMAAVSHALAEAGIPIQPVAAYSHDHLLVRGRDFERAWKTLSDFIAACKKTKDQ
ncbi:MAG TPA: ACT domain-containing protein [Anaerolineae bacterium]